MRTTLVPDALRMALGRRRPGTVALVHHSDRGYDNALAESFVDSFKTELLADGVWRTRSQLELAVVEYIGWFNHHRLHESLDDVPPAEMEVLYAPWGETNSSLEPKREAN
jgi:putative transposase